MANANELTPGLGATRNLLPQGFTSGGINSGVRKYRPDLGIIISERPCISAGVFTLNECKAVPIVYCQKILPSREIMAVITNSGQANAATGEQGIKDNQKMVAATADLLKCKPEQILVASTGVIGHQLEIGKITDSLPELILRRQGVTAEPFALAILTTDLVPKSVSTDVELSGGKIRITGICKGSGMIHPNMGTMLGYIVTDAKFSAPTAPQDLTKMLKVATDLSFNMISVDGDSSTNDCVFLMANGASEVEVSSAKDLELFQKAINDVSIFLAKTIAQDGEGASKLIEVILKGVPTEALARSAARGLIMSPLIKTAIHGESPNWGRILARLGAEGVPAACLDKMLLKIQGAVLFENGAPVESGVPELRVKLKQDRILIDIDLKSGTHQATAWGCDLSAKYVEINAGYVT